jgi:hypothetical protein
VVSTFAFFVALVRAGGGAWRDLVLGGAGEHGGGGGGEGGREPEEPEEMVQEEVAEEPEEMVQEDVAEEPEEMCRRRWRSRRRWCTRRCLSPREDDVPLVAIV